MASDDERREQANGLILGLVMLVVVVFACWLFGQRSRFTDFGPEVAPPAGEHSVLVIEEE